MLEQNDTAGRTNKTMRKELVPVILMDYEQAKYEISRIEYHYNSERRPSSLQYITLLQVFLR